MTKLFRYEFRRLLSNKWLWIILLGGTLISLALIVGLSFGGDPFSMWVSRRDQIIAEYPNQIELYRYMLTAENVGYLDRIFYNSQIELYTFLMESETVLAEYFSVEMHPRIYAGYEGVSRLLYLNEFIIYVYMLLAVGVGVWLFSAERTSGTFKNLLQTNYSRGKIYTSKYLFGAGIVMLLPVLMFIITSIACACLPAGQFLVYDGGYRAGSTTEFLMQIMLRNLVVVAVIYALTVVIAEHFKPLVATLLTIVVYFVWVFLSSMLTGNYDLYMLNLASVDPINYFPIIGLQNYLGGLTTTFFILLPSHLGLIIIFTFLSGRKFIRMDF